MTREERDALFAKFLDEHTARQSYITQLQSYCTLIGNSDYRVYYYELIDDNNPNSVLEQAFGWGDSTEGFAFWAKVCSIWNNKFQS